MYGPQARILLSCLQALTILRSNQNLGSGHLLENTSDHSGFRGTSPLNAEISTQPGHEPLHSFSMCCL